MHVPHIRRPLGLRVSPWRPGRWLPAILAAGLGGSVLAVQAPPTTPPDKTAPAAPAEKTYSITFDKSSWDTVFKWFSSETGLNLIGSVRPQGTATLNIKNKTLGETIDLINEALAAEKYVMLRGLESFTIFPADEKLPKGFIPAVSIEDLPKRGKSEVVRVMLPLKTLSSEEMARQVLPLLSNFGEATPLGANHLVVVDKAANVAYAAQQLGELEKNGVGVGDSLTYQCKFARALTVADQLRTLLSDKDTTVNTMTTMPGMQPMFNPQMMFQQQDMMRGRGGDREQRDRNNFLAAPRFRSVQIAVVEETNTIMITGPADKLAVAKQLLEKLDVGTMPRATGGTAQTIMYNVPAGTAETFGTLLKEQYKDSRVTRIQPMPGSNQIMVVALPADHLDIASFLNMPKDGQAGNSASEMVPLAFSDPTKVHESLTKFFPPETSGLTAQAMTGINPGVMLKGTPDLIRQAKEHIREAFDEDVVAASGKGGTGTSTPFRPDQYRIVTIEKGNAAAVAELMKRMMTQMGKEPPVIINPNAPPPSTPPKSKSERIAPPKARGIDPAKKISARPGEMPTTYISTQLVDPQEPKKEQPAEGSKNPVVITVQGNKLIISGGDAETQLMMAKLARVIITTGVDPVERHDVIRLKNISAEDAAAEIHEIFNGPPQNAMPAARGAGGRGGRGGINPLQMLAQMSGAGALLPSSGTPDRVRVVAEKTSNSLIVVKASEVDMITIRSLLERAIDSSEPPAGGVASPNTIQLQFASALDVAETIDDVFAVFTENNRGRGRGRGNQLPFPFGGAQEETQRLTVSADEASNKVIVHCTEQLFQEVEKLCMELDEAARNNGSVVKIVPISGLSPSVAKMAIDALTGRPVQQPSTGGFGNFGGGNRGGFGNFGGGNRGGAGSNRGGFGGAGGNRGGVGSFQPGGGRGANTGNRGGGNRGGGNQGGGNRGGGNRGGGNRGRQQSFLDGGGGGGYLNLGGDDGGRLNFDYRGMEAPSAFLFDPLTDPWPSGKKGTSYVHHLNSDQAAGIQIPQLPQPVGQVPLPAGQVPQQPPAVVGTPSPSANVTAEGFDDLGVLILRAGSQQEIEEIMKFLALLAEEAKKAEVTLEIVPMKNQDANKVVNTLTTVFSRIPVGPSGTLPVLQGAGFGGFGIQGAFGGGGQQPAGQLLLYPLPRQNSILVGAPKNRMDYIKEQIARFDIPNSPQVEPKTYYLEKASAQVVSQQVQNWFNQRFPDEPLQLNQVRVFFDANSNTVHVQASPEDQKSIASLIKFLDTAESRSTNVIKVIRLRNAFADEMTNTLGQTLITSVLNPLLSANQAGVTSGVGGVGGIGATGGFAQGQGGFGQGGLGQGGLGQGGLGQGGLGQGGFGQGGLGQGGFGTLTNTAGAGLTTKTTNLRFFRSEDGKPVESGQLTDVHIVPDIRINALVISAPEKTMILLESLINELDTVSAAQSNVNVFTLRRADATLTRQLLLEMFSSAQAAGGLGGFGGGLGGGFGGLQGGVGAQGTRPILTLTGQPGDGANLLDLRITADTRTNTIIVAGSRSDLETIRAILAVIDDIETPVLRTEVYKLHHQAAADVALAVTNFINGGQGQAVLRGGFGAGPVLTLQRNVVIIAEPISNTLMISAAPEMFDHVMQLILKIDMEPQQVFVSVAIVEVQLSKRDELGVEMGIQSPVLFARSSTGGTPGTPGFNFNTTSLVAGALPSSPGLPNTTLADPGVVGFQGLGNLGVGRVGANGVGGFVFSAASDTVNILIRALAQQGRVEVLSRPALWLTDQQQGFFQVGQQYPRLDQTVVTGAGLASQGITYENIGIVLRVTPRISPDGKVLMRVEPQISNPNPTLVQLGGGQVATAFDIQTIQTTVLASDGETVVLGGLIRKQDSRLENKIPFFGDLPWVGALFRFRTQDQTRRELVFILTPYILRNEADRARMVAQELGKGSWPMKDIDAIHGPVSNLLSGPPSLSGMCQDPAQYFGNPPGFPYTTETIPGTLTPVQPNIIGQPGNPAPLPDPRPVADPTGPTTKAPVMFVPGHTPVVLPHGVKLPMPQTQNAASTSLSGFPTTNSVGQATVFTPNSTTSTPAKEGQSWSVYGR